MARSPIAINLSMQRSRPVNAARLVNLYAEKAPDGSKCPVVLYGTPGLKTWATVGNDTIRCGIEAQGYAYILSGATLYRVAEDGTAEACTGDPIPNPGRAIIIDNGTQLGLLVQPYMFVVEGTVVTKVSDTDFPGDGASTLDYIDGYAVLTLNDNSGDWFISALRDFGSYDALDFASAESNPDGLLRALADHGEVWLFGKKSVEVWANTGASPFPFERIPGARLERGCGAAMSPARLDNSVVWLGEDRIVYRADGYHPVRISDHSVEELLRDGTVSDAYAMTYSIGGHLCYVLTLPSLGRTLVYDAATGWWHEMQSGTSLAPAAWGAQCIFTAFGRTFVGLQAGAVGELDLDTYADLGSPIRRAVASLPLYPEGKRAIMHEIEVEIETGVGISTGQGSSPEVMMRFSDDGGATWSNERRASIGALGQRRVRAEWKRNGMFRSRMYEFAISDPVKVAIHGAKFEMEGLAH